MNYAKLPGLTWDGTIYYNNDMGILEALLPTGGYPTAHSPAMLELPSKDLLCCWFAGTYEGSADIHIICSILPKDGQAWLPPVEISGDPTRSEQNPSLFYGPDNAVWAMYTAQLDRQASKDNMQFTAVVRCQKSTDGALHLAYASHTRLGVKYIRFTEQDVLGEKRERVGIYNPTSAQSR